MNRMTKIVATWLIVVVSILFCLTLDSVAQEVRIDSLLKQFAVAKDDTNKIKLANVISYYYRRIGNLDSSFLLKEHGVDIARKINNSIWEAKQLRIISVSYSGINFSKGLEYGLKSLAVAEKTNDYNSIGWAY